MISTSITHSFHQGIPEQEYLDGYFPSKEQRGGKLFFHKFRKILTAVPQHIIDTRYTPFTALPDAIPSKALTQWFRLWRKILWWQ